MIPVDSSGDITLRGFDARRNSLLKNVPTAQRDGAQLPPVVQGALTALLPVVVMCAIVMLVDEGATEGSALGVTGLGMIFIATCVGAGYLFTRRHVPPYMAIGLCAIVAAAFLLLHIHTATILSDVASVGLYALITNVAAAYSPQGHIGLGFLIFFVLWVVLIETEKHVRFGLLDAPGTLSYESRHIAMCGCNEPPCGGGIASIVLSALFAIFAMVANYCVVRVVIREGEERVAEARRQASKVQRQSMATFAAPPPQVTNDGADALTKLLAHLAAFDLEAAGEILTRIDKEHVAGTPFLPNDLTDQLHRLYHSMESYNSYIPLALLEPGAGSTERAGLLSAGSVTSSMINSIPGADGKPLTVVFTDVRQSTALWEHAPESMKLALGIHNNVIRDAIAANGGYEVKTIGDAFMIVFPTATKAVEFGVSVQTQFGEQGLWPAGLCRGEVKDNFPMFAMRIGVHHGEASVEKNVLTDRYDYFGSTVNKAARVEACGVVGAVTVTPAVLGGLGELEGLVAVPFAELRHVKGFTEALQLTAILKSDATEEQLRQVHVQCGTTRATAADTFVGVVNSFSLISKLNAWRPANRKNAAAAAAASAKERPPESYTRFPIASCGAVKFKFWEDTKAAEYWDSIEVATSTTLHALHRALARTDGVLSSLMSSVAFVSWGTFRTCTQHLNKSVQFLMLLQKELAGDGVAGTGGGVKEGSVNTTSGSRRASGSFNLSMNAPPPPHCTPIQDHLPTAVLSRADTAIAPLPYHAGLVTGRIGSGRVAATATSRFLTVLGPSVELSMALCNAATELNTHALVASTSERGIHKYQCVNTLIPHLRQVDTWRWHRKDARTWGRGGTSGVPTPMVPTPRGRLQSAAQNTPGGGASPPSTSAPPGAVVRSPGGTGLATPKSQRAATTLSFPRALCNDTQIEAGWAEGDAGGAAMPAGPRRAVMHGGGGGGGGGDGGDNTTTSPRRSAIAIYDLRVPALVAATYRRSVDGSDEDAGYETSPTPASAAEAFAKAYARAYKSDDASILKRLGADDPVIAKVAYLKETRTSLSHALVYLHPAAPERAGTAGGSTSDLSASGMELSDVDEDDEKRVIGTGLEMRLRGVRRLSNAACTPPTAALQGS